jgi:capsular exopolysaccharide synthesis family protein
MNEALQHCEPVPAPLHLRSYWQVLLRRRFPAAFVLAVVAGAGIARIQYIRPLYEAKAEILIEPEVPRVLDFQEERRVDETGQDFYQTQYRLLKSRLLAGKVIAKLGLASDPEFGGSRAGESAASPGREERAIDAFLGRLRVDPLKNSQLVAVRFRSFAPERAAEVANALVDAYIRQLGELRSSTSAETSASLGAETDEQAEKVKKAEQALQGYAREQGLGSIEERRTLLNQKLTDLGAALTVSRTRRLDKEALFRQMQSARSVEELPSVIESPLVQGLRTELASLERQRAQLAAQGYLEDHPERKKIREQIEGTQRKIAIEASRIVRAADNDYRVALAQEESARQALESAKSEAEDLRRRGLEYDALKRDLEASRQVSQVMLTRRKEVEAARGVQASNVHVIDPATVPRGPIRPRPLRDGALSLLLGLGCAVAVAFIRDYMDTTVGQPSDVRRLGVPVLAAIPDTRARKGALLVMNGHRKEPFAEGYRMLRAALGRPGTTACGQVLVVTSALPGEGKSITAANLALTLASTGERVLLVEADLRRPSLSKVLGIRRVPGLCEALCGVGSVRDAIRRVAGTQLYVLPSGSPVHSSPADLLATTNLRDLLAELAGSYDRIVVDTPPAGAVADAVTLAPLADGVLLVVQCGRVGTNQVLQMMDHLTQAGANVLGVVMNRARLDRRGYDYGPVFNPEVLSPRVGLLTAGSPRGPRSPSSLGRRH